MPSLAPPTWGYSLANAAENPLWLLLVALAAGAGVVWWSGTRLARWADVLADRTGMGRAFVGVLLLAGATSLPEVATTVTAAAVGNAGLAGNNLLGGLAMQLAVLAAVDGMFLGRGALSFFTPRPVLLMQGVMLALMCALATAAIAVGDRYTFAGVGAWSVGLAGAYALALWTMQRYEGDPRWQPEIEAGERDVGEPPMRTGSDVQGEESPKASVRRMWLSFAAAALVVLVGGYIVARAGDGIAVRTGLGGSFVGATLVALTTSLPEVSTTIAAVRMGAYAMAVSNILGTNAISVALLLVADVLYRSGSIINALDDRAVFLASLGTVLTCVYLWGLLERRDRTVARMGYDSVAVIMLYLGGLVVFYFVRGAGA
jgi:cation:H+ antiporter